MADTPQQVAPPPKLMVIGWDGADYHRVRGWIEAGKLPVLAGLCERGAFGPLQSTLPPLTIVAWTTLMTGMGPGGHGVFDWKDAWDPQRRRRRPLSIWELLSRRGRRVGVYNMPGTYPPSPVNGFIVSGLETPGFGPHMAYPPEAFAELARLVGHYDPLPEGVLPGGFSMDEVRHQVDCKTRAARRLLEQYRPEAFSVVYNVGDWSQHAYLPDPHYEAGGEVIDDVVLHIHQLLDRELGEWIARYAGPETTVMVVSDHGAAVAREIVLAHKLFWEEGWLNVRDGSLPVPGFLDTYWVPVRSFLQRTPAMVVLAGKTTVTRAGVACSRVVKRLFPGFFARLYRTRRAVVRYAQPVPPPPPPVIAWEDYQVDWRKTQAVPVGSSVGAGVRFRVKGRDRPGGLWPWQLRRFREQITRRLLELRDSEGQPVFAQVLESRHLYPGRHLSRGPDLLLVPARPLMFSLPDLIQINESWIPLHLDAPKSIAVLEKPVGVHAMEGILVAAGPAVRPHAQPPDARLMDLAPTMLYLLDEPIPSYMQGKLLYSLLDDGYVEKHPPRASKKRATVAAAPGEGYTEEEAQKLQERLSDLGYC